jgi:spore germination protein GerM
MTPRDDDTFRAEERHEEREGVSRASRTNSRMIILSVVAALVTAVVTAWLTVTLRKRSEPARPAAAATSAAPSQPQAAASRKIKARLFYVSMDGTKLTGVDREVAYGEGFSAQAQEIITEQLTPPPAPYVSAIPPGTKLRAIYVSGKGEAFVDLSKEVSSAHPGGTDDELLTIYAIVNALTANLPAVTAVQLLVDGKEVDTLAGHIDLRQPLGKNLSLVE